MVVLVKEPVEVFDAREVVVQFGKASLRYDAVLWAVPAEFSWRVVQRSAGGLDEIDLVDMLAEHDVGMVGADDVLDPFLFEELEEARDAFRMKVVLDLVHEDDVGWRVVKEDAGEEYHLLPVAPLAERDGTGVVIGEEEFEEDLVAGVGAPEVQRAAEEPLECGDDVVVLSAQR